MVKTLNRTLDEGIIGFAEHLRKRPISDNTRKAFLGDVRIFAHFMQPEQFTATRGKLALVDIKAEDIKAFLGSQERSGIAASPKSIERRLTSLKVFFKWLYEVGYLATDIGDGVAYKPFMDPLPEYLSEREVTSVVQAARVVASGERLEHRPLTAIMIVLETGIKKAECLALTLENIERDENNNASILIHYESQKLQFKDRRLPLTSECYEVIQSHVQRYETKDSLFDCTGRNLEYIFNRKVAVLSGLPALTFEMLRWT